MIQPWKIESWVKNCIFESLVYQARNNNFITKSKETKKNIHVNSEVAN